MQIFIGIANIRDLLDISLVTENFQRALRMRSGGKFFLWGPPRKYKRRSLPSICATWEVPETRFQSKIAKMATVVGGLNSLRKSADRPEVRRLPRACSSSSRHPIAIVTIGLEILG